MSENSTKSLSDIRQGHPKDDTPEIIITSFYGSEEDTAADEIKFYGSTNIKPKRQKYALPRGGVGTSKRTNS